MESKLAGSTYDDFEPFCNWRREEGRDTVVLHLPDFKKEQMKIQVSNTGVLKIFGERALNKSKPSRFYKEVKVPNGCNINEIHAKFVNGLLYVVMPKDTKASRARTLPTIPTDQDPNAKTSPEYKNNKMQTSNNDTSMSSENEAALGKTSTNSEFQQETSPVSTWKSCAKTGLKVGLAVALVTAIGTYLYMYEYKFPNVGYFDAFDT